MPWSANSVTSRLARRGDGRIVTPTFRKWHADLRGDHRGPAADDPAGVSDRLLRPPATALPAADAAARPMRIAASAGSTPENHQRALDVMALFGPQIVIAD